MTSDINQVQNGINMTLRLLLRSPFVVFGAMIMAFTVDLRSAMVFVVTIPVLCVVVFGIMLVSMPLYRSVQRQLDKVLLTTRENLMGVRVIRAFNRQESEVGKFEGENDRLVQMQVFVGKISALLNPCLLYTSCSGGNDVPSLFKIADEILSDGGHGRIPAPVSYTHLQEEGETEAVPIGQGDMLALVGVEQWGNFYELTMERREAGSGRPLPVPRD